MNRAPATNDGDSPPDPPPRKGQGRRLAIPLLGFLGMVGLVALFPVPVCRVMALVDCHTGSRQGYCRWAWGGRSGEWYQASAIETFMRERHPTELQPRWVSYQGNGMNLFGVGLDRSHGSPGPIISLHPTVIDAYCRTTSDAEKHRLYQVLSGGSVEEVHALVEQIILGRVEETATPATSIPIRWYPLKHSIEDYRRMQPGRPLVVLFCNEWSPMGLAVESLLLRSTTFTRTIDSTSALLLKADFTQAGSLADRELKARHRIPVNSLLVLSPRHGEAWIEVDGAADFESLLEQTEAMIQQVLMNSR